MPDGNQEWFLPPIREWAPWGEAWEAWKKQVAPFQFPWTRQPPWWQPKGERAWRAQEPRWTPAAREWKRAPAEGEYYGYPEQPFVAGGWASTHEMDVYEGQLFQLMQDLALPGWAYNAVVDEKGNLIIDKTTVLGLIKTYRKQLEEKIQPTLPTGLGLGAQAMQRREPSEQAQRIRAYQEAKEEFRLRQAETKWQIRQEWIPQQKLISQMYPREWAKLQPDPLHLATWYSPPGGRELGIAQMIQQKPEYKKLLGQHYVSSEVVQSWLEAEKERKRKEEETRMGELWAKPPRWTPAKQRA